MLELFIKLPDDFDFTGFEDVLMKVHEPDGSIDISERTTVVPCT